MGTKMMEDLLYEILPVIGFAICATSFFILLVMRRTTGTLMFCRFLAASDFLTGTGVLIDGFYGVMITIYGNVVETISPIDCLFRAVNIIIFLFTDYLHILIISVFTIDRLIQIVIPVSYGRVRDYLINWKLFIIMLIVALSPVVPGLSYAYQNRENTTVRVMSQCRFDDVVGDDFYIQHILTIQWAPIACIGVLFLTLIIFCIRQSRHKWRYNWSEESSCTKQFFAVLFIRCFLSALSVHLPLLFISKTDEGHEMVMIKDHIIRIGFWVVVLIIQPVWYLLILSSFQTSLFSLFNKYGKDTERKWQSADDPPADGEHVDRHGSPNPFGSWYSMTGNIAGEAGVPIENQRSVSFYYDS